MSFLRSRELLLMVGQSQRQALSMQSEIDDYACNFFDADDDPGIGQEVVQRDIFSDETFALLRRDSEILSRRHISFDEIRQRPIHAGSRLTLGSLAILVMNFRQKFKHAIGDKVIGEVVGLLKIVLPDDNVLKHFLGEKISLYRSLNFLTRVFEASNAPLRVLCYHQCPSK
jgi:hypothetical protein